MDQEVKPAFDPSKPFEAIQAAAEDKPPFDPNKPFTTAQTAPTETPVAAKPPFNPNDPWSSAPDVAGPPPPEVPAAAPAAPAATTPEGPPPEHNAFMRGLVSGTLKQNPELMAEALEGMSHLAPESLKGKLQTGSQYLRDLAKGSPEEYNTKAGALFDSKNFGDVATWAGEMLGQGIASSIPSMVTGAAGGVVGSLAGPVGTVAGGLAGAAVPSAGLNYGEVYKALKDEKVTPENSAKYAAIAAGPITALDVASLGTIWGKFFTSAAKTELNHAIAKRIAVEAAKGAGTEGVTEGIQDVIKNAMVSYVTGKPFLTAETGKSAIENIVGGALTGGVMGGGAGVFPGKAGPKGAPITPEDIQAVADQMKGPDGLPLKKPGGPPTDVPTTGGEPPPETPPVVMPTGEPDVHTIAKLTPGLGAAPTPIPTGPQISVDEVPQVRGEPVTSEAAVLPESVPVEGLYSRLRSWVEEKGPDKASAQRWNSILQQKDFTSEEMQDMNLSQMLMSVDPRETLTRQNLLDHLDANAITMQEVIRTPLDSGAKLAKQTQLLQQMDAVAQRDPTAKLANGTQYNIAHPEMQKLYDDYLALNDDRNWAKYQNQTTPGPRDAYVELTMHLPSRNVAGDPTQRDFVGGHYAEPNTVVAIRATIRKTFDGNPMALLEEVQSDLHQYGEKVGYGPTTEGKIPDAPFKDSWHQLGVTRFLMWAADNGIRHVAWADADEHMRRYSTAATPEALHQRRVGMQTFYNRETLGIVKRWSKRLGGTTGYTTIEGPNYQAQQLPTGEWGVFDANRPNPRPLAISATEALAQDYISRNTPNQPTRFRSLIIPQTGIDYINAGMPTHTSEKPTGKVTVEEAQGVSPHSVVAMQPLTESLQELIKQLNLGIDVKVVLHEKDVKLKQANPNRPGIFKTRSYPNTYGLAKPGFGGPHEIHISVGTHKNAQSVWATMVHELGHVVEWTAYQKAPQNVRLAVDAAYDKFIEDQGKNPLMNSVIANRDNAVVNMENMRNFGASTLLSQIGPKKKIYWMSKTEWFAEQVARWGTSREKPLSLVEKFFSSLGNKIMNLFRTAKEKFGLPFEPIRELNDWLDSRTTGAPEFFSQVNAETNNQTTVDNKTKMGPEETPAPQQPETVVPKDAVDKLTKGNPTPEVKETMAYADKFNWLYKWALGLHQVAQRNLGIAPLQEYTETISVAQLTKQQVMIRAQEILKAWNRLGERQADAVSALIDDVTNMTYRTPDEIARKVSRHPTPQELQTLATKHGVSQQGLAVFGQIATSFQEHLTRYEAVLRNEANKITDETKRGLSNAAIDKQMAALRKQPYFPSMRFGDYTITVRDAAGKVIHFETFESRRTRDRAAAVIQSKYQVATDLMQLGKMDRQVRPLLGVPTQLLDMMSQKLNLSSLQRDALEQLKFELSPAQSFQHRFQHKNRTAGYSMDFRRAYANYFFHGANHLMKAMYADRLRALTAMTRDEVKGQYDVTKRHEIVSYMNDHLENWLDPKSDWAAIRSVAFLWSLAFSPAAAGQNLTQTLMTSYPFLAQQFGDVRAIGALANAGRKFTTFYKKGTLEHATEFDQQAMFQGMADGVIKETQAPELAGFAEGNTLGLGFGGNVLQRNAMKFNELGAGMFEMAEQVNRRLIFRAALQLALDNPNAKYVNNVVAKRKLTYEQRRAEGWTEAQARAYTAAIDATITTQFQYGREYAPRFMRGKARTVFVFKTFIQNYVVFLANYPQAAVRSLLVMGALGGLMGVPGADDLKEILKAIGWRMFGKDFDLDQEARKLLLQFTGEDAEGRNHADLILHGISRKGYGIPAFMDMLGGTVGVDIRMPTFDRSRSISAGTLLPVELGKLFGPPTQDQNAVIAGQAKQASGAIFGAGFDIYKALTNTQLDWKDSKRWEKAVPRGLSALMHSYRVGTEGGERTSTGSQIVKYDVRDPWQLMEVLGMGAGYTPYRQSLEWEKVLATNDASKLWDIRRQGLMRQFGNAAIGKDAAEVARVREAIVNFNRDLPPEAKGQAISSDTLRKSVETRARDRIIQEQGLPLHKKDIPIRREVDKLYPDSQRTIKKVPSNLTP